MLSCGGGGDVVDTGTNDSTGDSILDSNVNTGNGGTTLPEDPVKPGEGDDITTVNPEVPTVSDVLKEQLDVFNKEDTFGDEGKIKGYTDYDGEINLGTAQTQYSITKGGRYKAYGKTTNSQIFIKAKDQDVILVLAGVELVNLSSAPAIYAEDCKSVTIVLAENTVNKLSDVEKNGENGVIRVRSCNLTLDGKGTLEIVANAKHGIANTKELTINGGTYNITAPNHGIYGKLKVTVNGGKFNINSQKSGIKSGDDEVGKEQEGAIVFNSGSAKITCGTNGLNAYGTVNINNGRIVVDAQGKGIVASKNLTVSGGMLLLKSNEDTIKSDGDLLINGDSSIRIISKANGIEAINATVATSSVIYIETSPVYVEDNVDGIYKLVDGEYVLIAENEEITFTKYSLIECKGFEIKNNLVISSEIIGVSSFEDSINAKYVELNGGRIVLSSTRDAIDASSTAIIDNDTDLYVVWANKGIKATESVDLKNGKTLVLTSSDAIDSSTVTISGGIHYLFEKIDCTNSLNLSGGTVVSLSTTTNPVTAASTIPYATDALTVKDQMTIGKWVRVRNGSFEVVIKLPKDYTEKACILVATNDLETEVTVEVGDCENAEPVNDYIYTNGSFNAENSEKLALMEIPDTIE